MRQGQHKQRARGRGRKVHNSANRSYDSNGPDVKIRGTATHIAEKYTAFARDAQVAGDRISSESYLQHAEHYLRIVAASQAHIQQQQTQQQSSSQPAANGQDSNGSVEAENGNSVPEEASVDGKEAITGEDEALKAHSGAGRQRRRRPASGRNGGGSRDRNLKPDTSEGPEPAEKKADENVSAESAPEADSPAEISMPKQEAESRVEKAVELDQAVAK